MRQTLPNADDPQGDTTSELRQIIEQFYRNYETDMAAVVPPFGQITDIKEQQRQSEHFWNKRMKEAIAAIQALIPEKQTADGVNKLTSSDFHRGYDAAIDTIHRNFTGQTDTEREDSRI